MPSAATDRPAVAGLFVPSALGEFAFAFDDDGILVRVDLPGRSRKLLDWGAPPAAAPRRRALRRWLDAALAGEEAEFPGPWRLPGASPFHRLVYACVRGIPPGEVRTYGEVAAACGSPGAARAVGNAMARNPLPILVPCHRVVGSGGLGGFGGGLALKRCLLAGEGYTLPSQAPAS